MAETLEELRKINRQLAEIQEIFAKGESAKSEYSIVTILIGFTPIFLFLISYFQGNPDQMLGYFMTGALFVFFFGMSTIWAIVQIARTKSPFTYSIAVGFPLFIIALPFVFSVLVLLHILPVSQPLEYLAIVVLIIYAVVFFAIFIIDLLYSKLVSRS
jgi:hypothetical protein